MGAALTKVGLIQLCSGENPAENLPVTENYIREAVVGGAVFILTPEVTNCISTSRKHQQSVLHNEADDPTLERLRQLADELSIWLLIGSLALKTDGDRLANRSFLIAPDGGIRARYDKIHMFDVELEDGESYRESAGFKPGDRAVLADTPLGRIGMSICYDVRFPHLYRQLAKRGAQILTVPSAFTQATGTAHWHVLLRARAIETGSYVLAPAQTGTHAGSGRCTYGHSLIVSPWGEIIADGGTELGVILANLDLDAVARSRARIPSLTNDRTYKSP